MERGSKITIGRYEVQGTGRLCSEATEEGRSVPREEGLTDTQEETKNVRESNLNPGWN